VSTGQTPLQLRLPAGRHRIRLGNDALHKESSVSVTITAERPAVIDDTR
jgi:hypothetical protein